MYHLSVRVLSLAHAHLSIVECVLVDCKLLLERIEY